MNDISAMILAMTINIELLLLCVLAYRYDSEIDNLNYHV